MSSFLLFCDLKCLISNLFCAASFVQTFVCVWNDNSVFEDLCVVAEASCWRHELRQQLRRLQCERLRRCAEAVCLPLNECCVLKSWMTSSRRAFLLGRCCR